MAFATTRPSAPLAPGTARLVPGDAAVTVHRVSLTAAEDAPLRSGDSLTVSRGIAVVQTATGQLLARAGTTIIFDGALPRIARGDVLIDATEKATTIGTYAASVAVDGLARVRQGLSLEVGVYRGVANIATQLDALRVPSLRRAVIAGSGASGGITSPLSIDANDSWDRNYLGTALELDAALSARSRGLTMQLSGAADDVRHQVLTTAAGLGDLTLLAQQPVGEVVVAAELARATKTSGVLAASLAQRAEGASWGLIAYATGLRSIPAEIPGIYASAVPAVHTTPVSAPTTVITTPEPGTKFRIPQPTTPPQPVDPDLPTTTTTVPPQAPVVVDPLGGLLSGLGGVLSGLLGP